MGAKPRARRLVRDHLASDAECERALTERKPDIMPELTTSYARHWTGMHTAGGAASSTSSRQTKSRNARSSAGWTRMPTLFRSSVDVCAAICTSIPVSLLLSEQCMRLERCPALQVSSPKGVLASELVPSTPTPHSHAINTEQYGRLADPENHEGSAD